MLSFERLFRDDFIDGSLEQLMLTAQPLALTALAKVVAHWLLTGLPLILLSPIAALLLSLEVNIWWALVLTLLVGTPILSCIGAIGVALTVGLRKGGVLLSLLCLLYTSDAADEEDSVDLGGRRIIKKKNEEKRKTQKKKSKKKKRNKMR